MSFWTGRDVTPKLKDRFIVKIAGSLNIFVKSVDKPTLTFENKEYKMMNHHFKYPGLPKWNSIKMTFVDSSIAVGDGTTDEPGGQVQQFLDLLTDSGYVNPDGGTLNGHAGREIGTVSKNRSSEALGLVQIQQIGPNVKAADKKATVIEEWKLINPIIKSVTFGSLAYGEDGLVEYTLELDYDYAEHSAGHNALGSA